MLEEYINTLDIIFKKYAEEQDEISLAYNKVTSVWKDKISLITGQALDDTGRCILIMHEAFSRILTIINRRYSQMTERYAERSWDANVNVPEFKVKLNLEENVNMDVINGTTVEGIKSFERALEEYIESTQKNLSSIQRAHNNVATGWKDDQYSRMTDKINEFSATINTQVNVLNTLQSWIVQRRISFEEALENVITD